MKVKGVFAGLIMRVRMPDFFLVIRVIVLCHPMTGLLNNFFLTPYYVSINKSFTIKVIAERPNYHYFSTTTD